jgi:hypothetical protein
VQLVLPPGFSGITAVDAVIPPNASETKLILKANKDAKGKPVPNVLIRATGRVGNINMVHEVKITLGVAMAGEMRPAPRVARYCFPTGSQRSNQAAISSRISGRYSWPVSL